MGRLLGVVLIAVFISCSSELTPEEQASLAAKGYYTHLVNGEYDRFLEGRVGSDSLPEEYREQLLTGYGQFMSQQQRAHKGIREVRVSNATTDSLAGYTSVFLMLCYGDSVEEEIVVPMVNNHGRWQMK